MGKRLNPQGFTIVETLIFLAVSTALFASAMALMTSQQNNAEFRYGLQEFVGQLRDISNDVSTGFYSVSDQVRCSSNPNNSNPPSITVGAADLGVNDECIYVGRMIHLKPDVSSDPLLAGRDPEGVYMVYSLVGKRLIKDPGIKGDRESVSLAEAKPIILEETRSAVSIPSGLKIKKVGLTVVGGGPTFVLKDLHAIAFVTNFASYLPNTSLLNTNARNLSVFTPNPVTANSDIANINNVMLDNLVAPGIVPGASGVEVCLEGYGNKVILPIGVNATESIDELKIERGDC